MTSLSTPAAASAAAPDDAELARRVRGLDVAAKVRLLTGATLWALPAEPRIGLHPVVMSDGPQGVRGTGEIPGATGLLAPAPSAVGAAWDVELAERLGALFATEARRKRVDVLLAPAVNLQRTPVAGRHFEYVAEDPLLTAAIAGGLVRGLQRNGVAGCPKHYVANDSETDRTRYRVELDERTLREVYLAPFEALVADADAWTVMAAYSGVDDGSEAAPMTEHLGLLRGVLKGEWHFSGPVVSDWAATRTTAASAMGGLDLVMPGPEGPWGDALVAAVRAGEVPESVVDDKVLRLLRLARHVGRLSEPGAPLERPAPPAGPTDEEFALLREVATRSTVLLRDREGLLPLDAGALRRVALIGPNAVAPYYQGGGSAFVPAVRTVGFEEGLRNALPAGVALTVLRGGDDRAHAPFADPGLLGDGITADFVDANGERIGGVTRRTGDWGGFHDYPAETQRVVLRGELTLSEPGLHDIEIGAVGRFTARVDGEVVASGDEDRGVEVVLDSTHHHPPGTRVEVTVGDQPRRVRLEFDLTVVDAEGYGRLITLHLRHRPPGPSVADEIADAVAEAARADVAVVVIGTNEEVESEGWDRTSLDLPGHQVDLVTRVAAANPRTVVVVNAGAPVVLPWTEDEVPTLLWAWLPGQEAGHALADVLLGRAEPAGRLPCTLPARADDVPVPHARPVDGVVTYAEGLDIGHRGWDRAGLTPAFPFGHGLGWTTWRYDSVAAAAGHPAAGDDLRLTVRIANTGPREGREVVQVYVESPDEGPERPVLTFAGFAGARVPAGESAPVTVTVPGQAFRVWDPDAAAWRTPRGRYRLHIGRSSRDLRLVTDVEV
ncbi:beta-glucosidase [Streptomyces sp. PT12]|uniref:beta-glucosidase family protein n=1 Tax=Streptomyces sp. PT12 TaxID=1510197 RepID=UPI000DE27D32|nr:glycoside hydrolase family 3 C-terminal domain-containing protein [Streptomyces sp. PT12]RBM23289.1 glycosyl hydrolase [Streptomyces sp. PT12]